MGQARLNRRMAAIAFGAVALGAGAAPAAGPSRFASYGTEADCVAARAFAPAACHFAFAEARAEYESKTRSFTSEGLCARQYASCMAWPPGGGGPASFRPRWDGVDIVDTPTEHSVTPSPGGAGGKVRFAARSLDEEPARLTIRGAAIPVPPPRRPGGAAPARVRRAGGPDRVPPPGSGFTLEDGVLTYPAPARFQPKNLPKE